MKWISMYCKNVKFILKTDDDIIVNTFSLLHHLKTMSKRVKIEKSVCIGLTIFTIILINNLFALLI